MTSRPSVWSAPPMATIATMDIAAQPRTSTVDAPASGPSRSARSWSRRWIRRACVVVGCMVSPLDVGKGWASAAEDEMGDRRSDEQDEDRSDDEHERERHRRLALGHQAAEVFAAGGAHVFAEREQRGVVATCGP